MKKTNEEKRPSFIEAVKPLMKWMKENCHPHHTTVVTAIDAELSEGQIAYNDYNEETGS